MHITLSYSLCFPPVMAAGPLVCGGAARPPKALRNHPETTPTERHDVSTGYRATRVSETDGGSGGGDGTGVEVRAESEAGEAVTATGEALLVATGRRPDADRLDVAAGGVEVDDRGFVETNEYLETTAESVRAQGDVAGNFTFKHSGDFETRHAVATVSGPKYGSSSSSTCSRVTPGSVSAKSSVIRPTCPSGGAGAALP